MWLFLIFGTFIVLIFIFLELINKKAKKILHSKYNIAPESGQWRSNNFDQMQNHRLIEYLKLNHLYHKGKIEILITSINKDLERNKIPSLIAPGIFISLFVPLWIQFLSRLFANVTSSEAISLLIYTALTLVGVIILFNFFRFLIKEMVEAVSFSDSAYKKGLVKKLEELLLTYPSEEK
ncbi:hypothetical protein [Paenibacillus sp. GXUN7292]|uniref:hypothetical protein n=1 Tax=Paenibacillus sp. GXUN7292 TaxID=3422499 RepID=UPI003D7ED068